MSKLVQFSGLLGVSAAVHVALFVGVGPDGGAPAGAGGAGAVTLAAAPPQVARLVEDWTRPVEVSRAPAALAAPPAPEPVVRTEAAKPSLPGTLPLPGMVRPEAPPKVDATPPHLPTPEAPKVRPKPRPKPPAPEPIPQPQTRQVERQAPAATPAPAQPAQRAAGSGQAGSAGGAKAATANAPSAARVAQLMGKWGGSIRQRVERRKRYPEGSRASGQVRLRLSVSTSGALSGVRVTRSSGEAALDRAALRAVQSARLPKAPKGIASGSHSFNLTIAFSK
ncbi:TonB family protein [Aliiroseovarius subalbicans]|uniref:TonB family protein n=1 Tax=Aliiroseovarius subalbicans TaxID=2925840 RepID=UPI001F5ACF28|nr:TonB family protein [Aliiroseovarius subalbicans]MCI2399225.1 energy transducer TonB [Aliiroseovarius subalbicans]